MAPAKKKPAVPLVEKLGLLIGSAGLFIIAIYGMHLIHDLQRLGKSPATALGVVVGAAVTGGIQALGRLGTSKDDDRR